MKKKTTKKPPRSKTERAAEARRRAAASLSRKRWMDGVIAKERQHVALWLEWYWYNRTYAFTDNHAMPSADWEAHDVEKMMKDITRAIRRGEALSKNEPVDGWAQSGERYEIEFDPMTGQGRRVRRIP